MQRLRTTFVIATLLCSLSVGGWLLAVSDDVTVVLKAGDQFKVLHENSLAEDDMCMATPAIAGDRLLIRTSALVSCIQSGAAVAGW